MINNWMVPRAKRKLTPVVDALSAFSFLTLGEPWAGDTQKQLEFETNLERLNLKRRGARRDQRAGGARTYESWFNALGLTYVENTTGLSRLTVAGEALINGSYPVDIMTHQLMKFQYPSPYSLRDRVQISNRFHIRPFRFLLRLLLDNRVRTLSKCEIARFVVTEAEDESDRCFNHVVSRILDFRNLGDAILPANFAELYPSSTTGVRTLSATLDGLEDNANTFINYLEYTQLIMRDGPDRAIYIAPEKAAEAASILEDGTQLIDVDPRNEEVFQRKFGLPPGRHKDTRNFSAGQTITPRVLAERMVRMEFLHIAGTRPISKVTPAIVSEIAVSTGLSERVVEDVLELLNVDALGIFEASYVDMAFSGTEQSRKFEIATVDIFRELGYETAHVGTRPLNPDVFVESPMNYAGIIDNKAYSAYSIQNDHRNRMVHNYIPTYRRCSNLTFFAYIAGGFISTIDSQIRNIAEETNVKGSAITAKELVALLSRHRTSRIDHTELRALFEINRRITRHDIYAF